jgi:Fe-S cluster assembly protein SufD
MSGWSKEYLQQSAQKNSVFNQHPNFLAWQAEKLESFLTQGFPSRHQENWKYTDVSLIKNEMFTLLDHGDVGMSPAVPYIIKNSYSFVFIDGYFSKALSNFSDLPKTVVIKNIASTADDEKDFLLTQWKNCPDTSIFSTLNAALLTDGFYLVVPENVTLEKPIHVLYLNTGENENQMNHPRNFISLGENSKVTLFEEYVGLGNNLYFNNVVNQITIQKNATLNHYKLQRENSRAFHMADTQFSQEKNSVMNSYHVDIGARLSRNNIQCHLKEEYAVCQLLGFYHTKNKQHIDNHTRIDHRVPHGSSRQIYYGIADGESHAVFNGKVLVHPHAQKTAAYQSNKNLLLSKTAEVDTKPELEIYADDVKCSHGATISQLDEEALFYLQTRGINQADANHLLTCAFANTILDQFPEAAIAESIKQAVIRGLSNEPH